MKLDLRRLLLLSVFASLAMGALPCSPYPQTGWPTIHGDPRNTDITNVPGATDLDLVFTVDLAGKVAAAATIDPQGRFYATSDTGSPCNLWAFEGDGTQAWCTDEVNEFVNASSVLIGANGNLFVGDDEAMHSFDREGNLRWETPVVGAPISAQFTSGGAVIFITHIGRIHLLRPGDGSAIAPVHELVPGATYVQGTGLAECFDGGGDCYSANTLSIDPMTDHFYFTLSTPSSPDAEVRAMRYVANPTPHYETLWTNDALVGGSASSPVLSADGTRVYVNDNGNTLWALDAATGASIWEFDIGYVPKGSMSVSDGGRIMPAGAAGQGLVAVQDYGTYGAILWERPIVRNRGIPVQLAGDIVYAVTARYGMISELDVTVLDATDGTTLDVVPLPGAPLLTVGTSISPDGLMLAPAFQGEIFGLRPAGS